MNILVCTDINILFIDGIIFKAESKNIPEVAKISSAIIFIT